jgi:hypothetical protein
MAKICQTFQHNSFICLNRIMCLLFWKWLTKYVWALMTKLISNMEETWTLVHKSHEDCGVWTKNQTWNCPKYEIMFICLKLKLIFLMFKMLSKAVISNFSDSWTSEITVSFIKTGAHINLLHSADWWWSMDNYFGNTAVRNKCVIQYNCSKMFIFKICLNKS